MQKLQLCLTKVIKLMLQEIPNTDNDIQLSLQLNKKKIEML